MNRLTRRLAIAGIGICLPAIDGALAPGGPPILAAAERTADEPARAWRLVHTPNPSGGPDAVSIMHTADTSRSDLELAGLMIRCNGNRAELAIILLRPFPLRARPLVKLGKPGEEKQFEATVSPPGTAVILPGDPKTIVGQPWQSESELFVRVIDGQTAISGVVALPGLQSAFDQLMANCPRS
jgi:hypothetical protein